MGNRKYFANEDFFNIWTEDSAYIVGFLSADGCVGDKNTLSIDIHPKDISILEYMRNLISPESQIEIGHKGKSSRLRINSKSICNSLRQHGVIERKTGFETIPKTLPRELEHSFIRGYFDGDGWVYLRRNAIECGLCCKSKTFLQSVVDLSGIPGRVRQRKKGESYYYQVDFYKTNCLALRDYMYHNDNFSLKRKKDKFYSNFYIKSKHFWLEEDIEYLQENYKIDKKSCTEYLSNKLNLDKKRIQTQAWRYGLCN